MSEQNPQIVMRYGPIPGSSYFLQKDEIYLGRDLNNDIAVPDPEISRRHARFLRKPEGFYIEDLGSTNGTFLNGVRISSPQLLKNGDLITLAENTVISFEAAGTQPHVAASPAQVVYNPEQSVQATIPPASPAYEPVQAPSPQQPLAPAPIPQQVKKKRGWFATFLLVLLAVLIVVGLVLLFMPASWWCALTFNSITGCPVY